MGLFHYLWSRTAASNATADSNINWAEGMAPSAVNDSGRAMMASLAAYRDDISGAITTSGTSTAYTVTSYQVFDTLAHLNGQVIAFTPHTTNGATVTLNVDGLGAKPLRSAPSVELPAGVLVQGTPYVALYNASDAAFYLQGFYSNPYSVPIGGFIPYLSTTAPNSSFVLPYGQAISRTTYATLFSLVGTTFGTGDGSTTFNIPDLRGRVPVGKDDMGGSAAGRVTSAASSIDGTTIGAAGGTQTTTLAQANLPNVTPTIDASTAVWNTMAYSTASTQAGASSSFSYVNSITTGGTGGGGFTQVNSKAGLASGAITASSINGGVSQTAFSGMQPSIIVPYILRAL